MYWSVVQNCSHLLIHSFNIYLISLFAMGISFMQYILREGACSIFLTVPEVLLNTAKVIMCSSLRLSMFTGSAFREYVSNVEKAEDWLSSCFSDVFYRNLLRLSSCGRGSKFARPLPLFYLPPALLELYCSILVRARSILSLRSGS